MKSRYKKIVVSLIYILFFGFVLSKLINPREISKIIREIKFEWILISVFLAIPGSFLGPLRISYLLKLIEKKVELIYIWSLANIGSSISLVFPFSAGGFAMPLFLAKKIGTSYKKTFFIIFLDAFFGFPLNLILGPLALWYFYSKKLLSFEMFNLNTKIVLISILVAILLIIFIFKNKLVKKIMGKFRRVWLILGKGKKILINPIVITLILFILGSFQSYLYYLAFNLKPPILDYIFAGILLGFLAMIPSTIPMKIGQFETFGVLTLPYLLGIDRNIIFSILLIQRIVSIIMISIFGFISLNIIKVDFGFLKSLNVNNLQDKVFSIPKQKK